VAPFINDIWQDAGPPPPGVEDRIAEVYAAFKGVTREGGVSWSETRVMDGFGTEEQCVAARASDTEHSWEELVDDPRWRADMGVGGFAFLDAIGFRYYLAPALIRELRQLPAPGLDFWLTASYCKPIQSNGDVSLNESQSRCVARAVEFFWKRSAQKDPDFAHRWDEALDHWRRWL
jgi:hypothetical protein